MWHMIWKGLFWLHVEAFRFLFFGQNQNIAFTEVCYFSASDNKPFLRCFAEAMCLLLCEFVIFEPNQLLIHMFLLMTSEDNFLFSYIAFLSLCLYGRLKTDSDPSIHFLYPLNSNLGGAGAYPSCHWARGGVDHGQVASPSQGHTETNETNNLTHSPRDNLESPFNLTCMGGGANFRCLCSRFTVLIKLCSSSHRTQTLKLNMSVTDVFMILISLPKGDYELQSSPSG